MTIDLLIAATLTVSGYSLWVRRDTWRSPWEIGADIGIVGEACGLVLMSPWAAHTLSPVLFHITHRWNTQQLLGLVCFIVAISAISHHALMRLADQGTARRMIRHQVIVPESLAVIAMAVTFAIADEEHHGNLFAVNRHNGWLNAYWVVTVVAIGYVSIYADWAVTLAGRDPRATEIARIYLVSGAFTLAACVTQASTLWVRIDVSMAVWSFACIAVGVFAYGSARSWSAKTAWLAGERRGTAPREPGD